MAEEPMEMQQQTEFEIQVPPEEEAGEYANFLMIWHTPHEFTLDYAVMQPSQQGENGMVKVPCRVVSRLRSGWSRPDAARWTSATQYQFQRSEPSRRPAIRRGWHARLMSDQCQQAFSRLQLSNLVRWPCDPLNLSLQRAFQLRSNSFWFLELAKPSRPLPRHSRISGCRQNTISGKGSIVVVRAGFAFPSRATATNDRSSQTGQ